MEFSKAWMVTNIQRYLEGYCLKQIDKMRSAGFKIINKNTCDSLLTLWKYLTRSTGANRRAAEFAFQNVPQKGICDAALF